MCATLARFINLASDDFPRTERNRIEEDEEYSLGHASTGIIYPGEKRIGHFSFFFDLFSFFFVDANQDTNNKSPTKRESRQKPSAAC